MELSVLVRQRGVTAKAKKVNAMNRLLLSASFCVVLTLSAVELGWSQQTVAPTDAAPAVIARPVSVKLPIRLVWNYMVIVEGSIGNVQKLHFLVDTGAYPSIVDQKIAHDLGLAEQPARVNLANKSVGAGLVILPSLLLGPVRAEALPVLTQDLSYMRKAVGYKVDAIIGLDVLRRSSFTIDYRAREIVFGPVEGLPFSAPFDADAPVVTIRTRMQNHELRLVVDTGSPDVMLFESRMSDSAGLQTLGTQETVNASGRLRLRKVWIPEVYLGQERIGGQAAFIVNDHKDAGDDFDGVLGMKAPQQSKVAFDFERRRFCWELSGTTVAINGAGLISIRQK
jgi:predicted aspartyl protease